MEAKIEKVSFPEGKDKVELIITAGELPKDPLKLTLVTDINGPAEFVKKRPDVIKSGTCHALVAFEDGQITLFVNDADPLNHHRISGGIKKHPDYIRLKANSATMFDVKAFREHMRYFRRYFLTTAELDVINERTKNFSAKITRETKNVSDETTGAVERLEKFTSDWEPLEFTLKMPLHKGGIERSFRLSVMIEITSANTRFWLDSDELFTIEPLDAEEMMKPVIEALKETGIPVLFQ